MMAYYPHIKRFVDVAVSFLVLVVSSPFLLIIGLLICLESRGAPFFIQERIGLGRTPFFLIKFRSMIPNHGASVGYCDLGEKSRLTRLGRFLRRTKLDELPELINVLKGDMSIVGPRPEIPGYVQAYADDYREILSVRPGLSDYASIVYRNEEHVLAAAADPEQYYLQFILPDKLRLAKRYVRSISFRNDLSIVIQTIRALFSQPDDSGVKKQIG